MNRQKHGKGEVEETEMGLVEYIQTKKAKKH